MKSVYDFFIEYFMSIRQPSEDSQKVEAGIAAYLNSVGLLKNDVDESRSKKIAQRELARFKLMPLHTFIAFFENFELREQIQQIEKECKAMAINRADSGKKADQSFYQDKIDQLYGYATSLASDKRYKGWLDEITREITECLKFAVGISDEMPDSIAEAILYRSED